jgi:hypothetical protein
MLDTSLKIPKPRIKCSSRSVGGISAQGGKEKDTHTYNEGASVGCIIELEENLAKNQQDFDKRNSVSNDLSNIEKRNGVICDMETE